MKVLEEDPVGPGTTRNRGGQLLLRQLKGQILVLQVVVRVDNPAEIVRQSVNQPEDRVLVPSQLIEQVAGDETEGSLPGKDLLQVTGGLPHEEISSLDETPRGAQIAGVHLVARFQVDPGRWHQTQRCVRDDRVMKGLFHQGDMFLGPVAGHSEEDLVLTGIDVFVLVHVELFHARLGAGRFRTRVFGLLLCDGYCRDQEIPAACLSRSDHPVCQLGPGRDHLVEQGLNLGRVRMAGSGVCLGHEHYRAR